MAFDFLIVPIFPMGIALQKRGRGGGRGSEDGWHGTVRLLYCIGSSMRMYVCVQCNLAGFREARQADIHTPYVCLLAFVWWAASDSGFRTWRCGIV